MFNLFISLKDVIKATTYEIDKSSIAKFQKFKSDTIEKEFEQMKGITDFSVDHANSLFEGGKKLDRYSDILPCKQNKKKIL